MVQPAGRFKSIPFIRFVLRVQLLNQSVNFRILSVLSKKRFQPAARIGEERSINEIDGCRRAFDVKKDDADLRTLDQGHAGYFAAVCGGMYLGPQQTGS